MLSLYGFVYWFPVDSLGNNGIEVLESLLYRQIFKDLVNEEPLVVTSHNLVSNQTSLI